MSCISLTRAGHQDLPVVAKARDGNTAILTMATQSGKPSYLELAGVWPPKRYRVRRVIAIFLAISPPIACAFLAGETGRWDLFERSGSITTAIGLLLASRRYLRYSVLELADLHEQTKSNTAEALEDIFTAKLGLALSAFGTIIWGWGKYLGWASFTYLLVWVLFAARDFRRDGR